MMLKLLRGEFDQIEQLGCGDMFRGRAPQRAWLISRESVPRAYLLTDIATIDHVSEKWTQRDGDTALEFDGEV